MANDYIVVDTNAVQNLFAGGGVTVTLAITPKLHQTQLCLGGRAHGRRGSAGSGSGWTLNCCAFNPVPKWQNRIDRG
jgi:hypothetical protein